MIHLGGVFMKIEVHSDGGCSPNPGPGAWAYVIKISDNLVSHYGTEKNTTNNQMELQAVIEALKRINGEELIRHLPIDFYTDSKYVKNGITEWIHTWIKNGWLTASKKPVKNKELWINLKNLAEKLCVSWFWEAGHSDSELNLLCHKLVQQGLRELRTQV
jgi:ribonuclease HI